MSKAVRSVLAILAGYALLAFLVGLATRVTASLFRLAADPVTGGPLEQPPAFFSVVLLLLSLNAAVIAGYVTAAMAGRREVIHAAVLPSEARERQTVGSLSLTSR